jgi:hypothetical protein
MSKIRRPLCAFAVVLLSSALNVAGASATLWLKNGLSLTKTEAASMHSTLILHHEGGLLGTTRLECSVLFAGTVGPIAEDAVTLIEGLTGEKDLQRCRVTQGFCSETIDHPENLPWKTKLVLVGTETFDETLSGVTTPASLALCATNTEVTLLCYSAGKAKFIRNGTNGAEFELSRAITETTCQDGGKAWAEGVNSILGFTVS